MNFITRGTIEERVQRTLIAKQGFFNGLFAGDEDEFAFESTNASGFLDAMRGLIDETVRLPEAEPIATIPLDQPTIWHATVHLLEGVSALLASQPIPEDVRVKLREQLRILNEKCRD